MKALKKTDEKKHKDICTKIREDGAYVEAGENDNLLVQKVAADPGALGVLGYSFLEENADKVAPVSIAGIAPTEATISDLSYPGAASSTSTSRASISPRSRRSSSSSPPMPRRGARAARSRSAGWCRSAPPMPTRQRRRRRRSKPLDPARPEVSQGRRAP